MPSILGKNYENYPLIIMKQKHEFKNVTTGLPLQFLIYQLPDLLTLRYMKLCTILQAGGQNKFFRWFLELFK